MAWRYPAMLPLRIYQMLLLMMVLARYWLVSNAEVVGAPYDTDLLAYLTLHGIWNHPVDPLRPPLFLALTTGVQYLGIPWRMFLELAFLASAWGLAAVARRCAGAAVALTVVAAYLFNPYALRSFDEFQREPMLLVLYVCFFLAWAAYLLQAQRRGAWRYAALYGLLGACIVLTREGEELFVVLALVLGGVASVWVRRGLAGPTRGWRPALVGLAPALLIPAAIVLAAVGGARYYNGTLWGVFSLRGQLSVYQELLTQVHRIRVDDAARFAPATRQSFVRAAELSPAFAALAGPIVTTHPVTETEKAIATMREHAAAFVGRDEIDTSRTIWALVAVAGEKYGADSAGKTKALRRATAELKAALDAQPTLAHSLRLPYPFDPNLNHWMPFWMPEVRHSLRMLLAPSAEEAGVLIREDWNAPVFNAALNRRSALVLAGPDQRSALRDRFVARGARWMLLMGVAAVLAGALTRRRARGEVRLWLGIGAVVAGMLAARVLLYSALVVSVAPVQRYQVFLSPLCAALAILGIGLAASCLRGRIWPRIAGPRLAA